MFLHAYLIGFASPLTGRRVQVAAPLDEKLVQVLESLGLRVPRPRK
jgi:hypothetical protein